MLDTAVPSETVAVRNLSKTRLILSGDTRGASIEWGEAGSPDGSDLQEIPMHVWNSAWMRRAKARGLVALDTMESLDDAVHAQRAHLARQEAERQAEVNSALKAGTAGAPIVISEAAFNAHVERTSKTQGSEVLDDAMEAQRVANENAAATAAAAEAEIAQVIAENTQPPTDPMAALDAAIS